MQWATELRLRFLPLIYSLINFNFFSLILYYLVNREKKLKPDNKINLLDLPFTRNNQFIELLSTKSDCLGLRNEWELKKGKHIFKRPDTQDYVKNESKRRQMGNTHQNIKMYTQFDLPNAPGIWMGLKKLVLLKFTDLISNCSVLICHTPVITEEVCKLCPTKLTL